MSLAENKALVSRFYDEIWNQGNLALTDELVTPDFTDPTAPPDATQGAQGLKDFVVMNVRRLPDLRYTVHELIAEGDRVVAVWTGEGTNEGELRRRSARPLPPTGKRIVWTGTTVFRVRDGKLAEMRIYQNLLGVFRDLGLVVDAA